MSGFRLKASWNLLFSQEGCDERTLAHNRGPGVTACTVPLSALTGASQRSRPPLRLGRLAPPFFLPSYPPGPLADKKTLNVGKSGLSAGLDDYVYEGAAGPDDEYDFM